MAQEPLNKKHKNQIIAGTIGRRKGHLFEHSLALSFKSINVNDKIIYQPIKGNITTGNPSQLLIRYIVQREGIKEVNKIEAWWMGGLATSGEGDHLVDECGNTVTKCKSDIVLSIGHDNKLNKIIGVSVKSCNKNSPTNDQIYFTTATAFCDLLKRNGISVSNNAEIALKMFCGDAGYRPKDTTGNSKRGSNPDRWFWEELPEVGRCELEGILSNNQRLISKILLQKAYRDDPFPPEYIIHQTHYCADYANCEIALFKIDELIDYSCKHSGFHIKEYLIKKGAFKKDANVHSAPRFGFIQMQRGGQRQHPTQLQFNLEAGYFYKINL